MRLRNVLTIGDFAAVGVSRQLRAKWMAAGVIEQIGVRTFAVAGAPRTWEQSLTAGLLDLGPAACVAGHGGAALLGLDGFVRGSVDFLVPRPLRDRSVVGRLASTTREVPATDVCRVDGIRVLRAERLILEAPLFDFTREEVENAIDSAVRLQLTTEARLRQRVEAEHCPGINGSRVVLDALVDAGGESKLERAFLRVLRHAGVPRPALQVSHRHGLRFIARVDTMFGVELVIEVEGHRTHSSRQQRQADEQRRTELTIRGKRVITFTYDDVIRRPDWTVERVREALSGRVASA